MPPSPEAGPVPAGGGPIEGAPIGGLDAPGGGPPIGGVGIGIGIKSRLSECAGGSRRPLDRQNRLLAAPTALVPTAECGNVTHWSLLWLKRKGVWPHTAVFSDAIDVKPHLADCQYAITESLSVFNPIGYYHMLIPSGDLDEFVRDITDQCFASRIDRINRGAFFQNYFESGTEDMTNPALFNKLYASLDDIESLLYSPVALRFKLTDPEVPNVLNRQKHRIAAAKIRGACRRGELDSMISAAVRVSLVKGKGFIKLAARGKEHSLHGTLVQPEDMGVLRENHTTLDQDMEAFSQRSMITIWQFDRLLKSLGWSEKAERDTRERAKNFQFISTGDETNKSSAMQITVGGMYPFQPGSAAPSQARGLADWLSQPKPNLSPEIQQTLLPLDETWMWDDRREDWATFQMIGDILLMGRFQLVNALAYDANSQQSSPFLKSEHPYREFCVNPVDEYFWGASELRYLVPLQEQLNARMVGINKMLRKQEDPTLKFVGSTGVNQNAVSRYNKPGGYWSDSNPNAKIERDTIEIPADLHVSVHETERQIDEMVGLPPTARGKGDAGVRSHRHADTLVRQASPRFKDRALLVERSVEAFGALILDLKRAHDSHKLIAWVPQEEAGGEGDTPDPLMPPPAPGLVAVRFTFADLEEGITVEIDSHSSSPAFSEDSKMMHFDLLKVGAESKDELVEHLDVGDPEELQAGIMRRDIAAAEAKKQEEAMKMLGKKH